MSFEYSPDTSVPVNSSWRNGNYADNEGGPAYYHFWGLEKDFVANSIARIAGLFDGIEVCGEHHPELIPIMPIEDLR